MKTRKICAPDAGRSSRARAKSKGAVVWFTGLSGSGKTTLAQASAKALNGAGVCVKVLDGDHLRKGLCSDLGFSETDRAENIRRVAEVAALFADAGLLCLVALISPLRKARAQARVIIGKQRFLEIYVAADLAACEQRDVKGLYKRARAGRLRRFTGLASPYEPPLRPHLSLDTSRLTKAKCVAQLMACLAKRGWLDGAGDKRVKKNKKIFDDTAR